jgi:membrane protein
MASRRWWHRAWLHPHGLLAGTLGVVALLLGASGVFSALRNSLNQIGRVVPKPSLFGTVVRARLVAFALVLGLRIPRHRVAHGERGAGRAGRLPHRPLPGWPSCSRWSTSWCRRSCSSWPSPRCCAGCPDAPPSMRAAWAGAACSALLFAIGKHLIGLYLARASLASATAPPAPSWW